MIIAVVKILHLIWNSISQVIKYLDRYIMYYILTADRLERTAPWQAKLPGGKNGGGPIEHLK
jgi:NAD(P)H-nitrite reductase large subunit